MKHILHFYIALVTWGTPAPGTGSIGSPTGPMHFAEVGKASCTVIEKEAWILTVLRSPEPVTYDKSLSL